MIERPGTPAAGVSGRQRLVKKSAGRNRRFAADDFTTAHDKLLLSAILVILYMPYMLMCIFKAASTLVSCSLRSILVAAPLAKAPDQPVPHEPSDNRWHMRGSVSREAITDFPGPGVASVTQPACQLVTRNRHQ